MVYVWYAAWLLICSTLIEHIFFEQFSNRAFMFLSTYNALRIECPRTTHGWSYEIKLELTFIR